MKKLLLGIDLGTGGCKVNIIDSSGAWIASGASEYQTFHQYPQWSEQNPTDWYIGFKNALLTALDSGGVSAKDIVAIGVDASTHNAVLLDANMSVLCKCIMWTDQRSTEEVRWLNDNFGKELLDITYQMSSTTWTLPQLLWIQRHEEDIFKQVRHIMFTKDYLRYKLTGTWETDYIDAQGSMLMDMKRRQWSERVCEIGSIPLNVLPPLKEPLSISGSVTAVAAAETGLQAGTPVIVGTSDTAAESYGVGILEAGQCVVKMATAGTVNVFTEKPSPNPKALTYSFIVPGLWYTLMATNSAAESMRWFRDVFGREEIERAKIEKTSAYTLIDQAASSVRPGANGLFFHPYLMGERSPYWDPNLRASFTGISAYHQKSHFSRAIMEGVAYSLKDCFRAVEEMNLCAGEIRFIGGGAKSSLWRVILANVLAKPILKVKHDDASFGIAMLAGVGEGIFSDLRDAVQKCVKVVYRINPDPEMTRTYEILFQIYKKIHDDLTDTYGKLSEISKKL